jgi:hypothetical protein
MDENPAKKIQVQDEGVQLTPNILITFAMIIQAFARLEWLIQMSMDRDRRSGSIQSSNLNPKR